MWRQFGWLVGRKRRVGGSRMHGGQLDGGYAVASFGPDGPTGRSVAMPGFENRDFGGVCSIDEPIFVIDPPRPVAREFFPIGSGLPSPVDGSSSAMSWAAA